MKKFVVLMLVLCLATSANATLQLSVNGLPAPDQITLAPSDWIELDVTALPGFIGGQFTIQLSNSQGILDWSGIQFDLQYADPVIPDVYTGWNDYDYAWRLTPSALPEPHRVTVDGGNMFDPIIVEETLVWNLMFHCEEATDVEILLISDLLVTEGGDIAAGTLLDSLYIVQIPEPMTIALLGLGGLFLRRRK